MKDVIYTTTLILTIHFHLSYVAPMFIELVHNREKGASLKDAIDDVWFG